MISLYNLPMVCHYSTTLCEYFCSRTYDKHTDTVCCTLPRSIAVAHKFQLHTMHVVEPTPFSSVSCSQLPVVCNNHTQRMQSIHETCCFACADGSDRSTRPSVCLCGERREERHSSDRQSLTHSSLRHHNRAAAANIVCWFLALSTRRA